MGKQDHSLEFPERFQQLSDEKLACASKSGLQNCRKKPIIVQAAQIDYEFRVKTLEGDYKQGKPGDYLMRGIDDELYIRDKSIFERTYDWVEDSDGE